MTIKELLEHQQRSSHICLINQGLFFRAYNQGAVLLNRLPGYQMWSGGDCLKIKWKDKIKMNMKTKSLLSAIAVVVLSTTAGYAQRVETDLVDGHPVINCEAMPASLYTTTPKGNTEMLLKTDTANEKVYKRFAVNNSNNNTSSTWSNAFTVCSGISGGGWRLPTQRELMLIWVLYPELKKTSGFLPFIATNYWSATKFFSDESRLVHFGNGFTYYNSKTSSKHVRCVREL